jgi:sec-independent protein translocase protein TatA
MFGIGTPELIMFGIIAVILFGGRLPSVARSLGKSIVEFKKGMTDLESEVKSSIYSEPPNRVAYDDNAEPAGARFEPPKA